MAKSYLSRAAIAAFLAITATQSDAWIVAPMTACRVHSQPRQHTISDIIDAELANFFSPLSILDAPKSPKVLSKKNAQGRIEKENSTEAQSTLVWDMRPQLQWKETDQGIVLIVATPGLSKTDLSVEVVSNHNRHELVLSGGSNSTARKAESGASSDAAKELSAEVRYEPFEWRRVLPERMNLGSMAASYEDGILTVRIAKKPLEEPTRLRIGIA